MNQGRKESRRRAKVAPCQLVRGNKLSGVLAASTICCANMHELVRRWQPGPEKHTVPAGKLVLFTARPSELIQAIHHSPFASGNLLAAENGPDHLLRAVLRTLFRARMGQLLIQFCFIGRINDCSSTPLMQELQLAATTKSGFATTIGTAQSRFVNSEWQPPHKPM